MVEDFNLRTYLLADLRRAQILMGLSSDNHQGISLYLKLFTPRFLPILFCRLAYSAHLLRLSPLSKFLSLLNFFLFGIEIAISCQIGKGLYLPHTQGTVIGAWHIGENATIYQGVTLGAKELDFFYQESLRPKIGNNVTIGAGAKVLGGLSIGDNVTVGANAVVISSVLYNSVVGGIPAKTIKFLDQRE